MSRKDKLRESLLKLFPNPSDAFPGSVLGQKLMPSLKLIYGTDAQSTALTEFKAEYGGLGRFIQIHCKSCVHEVGRSGSDILYSKKRLPQPSPHTRSEMVQVHSPIAGSDVWKVFVNPTGSRSLHIRQKPTRVDITSSADVGDGDTGPQILRSTSLDDHRSLIREFLDKNIEEDHETFRDRSFIGDPDYWGKWQDRLSREKKINGMWAKFRKAKLEKLFVMRLRESGLEDEEIVCLKQRILLGRSSPGPKSELVKDDGRKRQLLELLSALPIEVLEEISIPLRFWGKDETSLPL